MNTDPPFTTHGDEPIEARIVSWVLGEASDFEAAELQRLCEERPELLVFRQRIREIHGLLGEDEHPIPLEMWKLPPEKRRAIEELFGDEPVRLPMPRNAGRIRRRIGQVLLAAAACVALSLLVAWFYPFQEEGRAVIEVRPRVQGMSPFGPDSATPGEYWTPRFFSAEFAKIRSRETIKQVVDRLDLAERWNVDEETAIERVRDKVRTKQVKGTGLIEIRARDDNELDAKRIAREVALAYRDYREELARNDAEKALAEFNKAIRAQEDKVEERRKVLTTIARAKKINYKGNESYFGSSGPDEDKGARDRLKSFYQSEQEKMQLESQVKSLEKYEGDQLMVYAAGLQVPDNSVRDLYPRYLEAKRQLESRNIEGVGDKHPAALADKAKIENLKTQLDQGIANLQKTLQSQLDLANERMSIAQAEAKDDIEDSIKRGLDAQDYVDAKRDFQTEQELLQNLKLKLIGETVSSNMPRESVVIVEDPFGDASSATPAALAAAKPRPEAEEIASVPMKVSEARERQKRIPATPSRPAAPAASPPAVVTSPASQLSEIAAAESPSLQFGGGDDFGNGWGMQDEGAKLPALRSGDVAIDRSAIDAILAKPQSGEGGVTRSAAALTAEHAAEPAPALAAGGYLMDLSEATAIPKEGELDAARMLFDRADEFAFAGVAKNEQAAPTGTLGRDFRSAGEPIPGLSFPTEFQPEYHFRGSNLSAKQPAVAPKSDPAPVEDETLATDDPYSTFSLNVSDASFQLAKAALAKGERPDPGSIKPEQFYNAVDYQDPAPAGDEPVAVNIEQSAHPIIPGRNLVRIALKTAASGRAASQPLRLTLLVDHSGSMVREDRRAALEQALAGLSGLLTADDRVTVIGFSRTPRLLADSLPGDKAKNLADLIHLESSEGGTNLEEALVLGERLALRAKLAGAQNRIVLFTDGAANLGNADPEKLSDRIRGLRGKGLAIDIAGMAADDLNDSLLAELARNGNGRYHVVGKGADGADFAKHLAGAFRPAAENVKVQVRFNPERVGRYKLIGFEKDRLKTEDFRNDAVDAAEMAAEEAGVAVYQIEPLPGGTGEIGEVSVRFRDTATATMVERNWTIPHDAQAPAFDRAAPSMQLAGLATLAAEKLRGGPTADAIDFRKLAEVRARVKHAYAGSPRVAELLEMIGTL